MLKELKPKRVVIAHKDINKEASGGIETLKNANIDVSLGCMQKEAYDLLYPFIKWTESTFVFFKMAMTLNGSIDGKISSNQTLAYTHTLRDKIDLMLIGGNTVRTDRPTLDARYIAGRSPNIMIYSKNKIFDNNIPLFKIPNRDVFISDDLFKLLDYKFVMVEGTYNLMNILKQRIDFVVLLVNPKMRKGLNAVNEIDIDFEILHENFIGSEKVIYLRKKE
ncbi:dihydrofolate reductase family protein [Halarcobacter anaerophilus]|uniref:dihydrofolate reductase family protein n=1 Tax=Halarcobacter anaerophilus TaxID=877500 RepID=UPI000A48AF2E|nr:dihydrofolate reductase family protein [Halarcobacter anaerophilus]